MSSIYASLNLPSLLHPLHLQKNSVNRKLPKDRTADTTISNNVFGRGMPAECIDIKEYTLGGKIMNNRLIGNEIKGANGAVSMVAIKGNGWLLQDNVGVGCMKRGQGYRVISVAPKQGKRKETSY